MKAYLLTSFEAAAHLGQARRPSVGDGEILIRVLSSSINPVDRLIAGGFFRGMQDYHLPAVLGRDVSGVVEEVGAGVTRFVAGDRVFGFVKRNYIGDGTFGEFVVSPHDRYVTATPDAISTQHAGVLGVAAVTAQECLETVALTSADTVFINGATGGTGTFAVQFARAIGARVLATARPGEQTDLVRSLGADEVLDWTAGHVLKDLRDLAPDGVDAIVDLARPPAANARAGERARGQAFADLVHAVGTSDCRVASTTNSVDSELLSDVSAVNVHSDPAPAALDRVAAAVAAGSVRPVLTDVYDFEDIAAAFDRLNHSVIGKIGLRISPEG